MKRWVVPFLAVALVGVLAGCSSSTSTAPAETIELTAANMAFGSKELTLEKGKTYKLVLKNTDSVEHDFAVTKIPIKVAKDGHKDEGHGTGGTKADLHVHADAGKTEAVEFTVTEAGSYNFNCTVAGHKEAGMVGKVIVK